MHSVVRLLSQIALIGLVACVSSGTEVTAQQAAQFTPGSTTEAEVTAKIGPPNSTATKADGSTSFSYVHYRSTANAASYVPVVGLFAGGMHGNSSTVTFDFDKQGVLLDTTSSTASLNTNTGLANQK